MTVREKIKELRLKIIDVIEKKFSSLSLSLSLSLSIYLYI